MKGLSGEPARARIEVADGVELDVEVHPADGDPVLLVHAGCLSARWFEALVREPALAGHALVTYHRAGYATSSRPAGPVSIADHAEHARVLLGHLGIARAHVVGHSSSAMIALQLALDAPSTTQSLALLESARPSPASPVQEEFVAKVVRPALAAYRAGDLAAAVDTWMTGVCGSQYRSVLERNVPGAFEHAVADADTFFGQELAAVQQWVFGPAEAARVGCPAMVMLGSSSRPTFAERRELLLALLPDAEPCDVASSHLLPAENPSEVAAALAGFFDRHAMAA